MFLGWAKTKNDSIKPSLYSSPSNHSPSSSARQGQTDSVDKANLMLIIMNFVWTDPVIGFNSQKLDMWSLVWPVCIRYQKILAG